MILLFVYRRAHTLYVYDEATLLEVLQNEVVTLMEAYVPLKFKSMVPSHIWSHPCHRRWCIPIPTQTLAFAPFSDNGLDGFFHLCRNRRQFFPKASETWTHLTTQQVSSVFLSIWDELVSRELSCVTQFQVTFLEAVLSENCFQKSSWDHVALVFMPLIMQSCLRSISNSFLPHNTLLHTCWKTKVLWNFLVEKLFLRTY